MANDYQDVKAYEEYLLDCDRKQYEEDCAFEEYQKTLVNPNRYREALDSVIKTYDAVRRSFAKHLIGTEIKEVESLRELVDKEAELQSRKDKLVVGSEWICTVKHVIFKETSATNNHIGDVVKIIDIRDDMIFYQFKRFVNCLDFMEHFLLCFKPNEKTPDKSIPKKPLYPEDYPAASCPSCGYNLGDNAKCRNCDQTIDWSDDDNPI